MSKQDMSKKEQLKWTEKMDAAYIQAMITQQDIGNRVNGSFTTQAYANMIEEMTAKLQINVTKDHLKNRYKTLKKCFSQWYDLFKGASLSDFSWNSATQLIEAEDQVWEELINSNPEAASLKTKRVSNYNEMLQLFARDRNDVKLKINSDVNELLATKEVIPDNHYFDYIDDVQVVSPTPFSPEQSSSAKKLKSKKRKVQEDEAINKKNVQEDEAINLKLMKSIDNLAVAIMEGFKIFNRAYPHEYTGEEIYTNLKEMGLEPYELPRALNFLADNQVKARTLFSCPLQIRMDVLKDMMMGARL